MDSTQSSTQGESGEVTRVLERLRAGDPGAARELFDLVQRELRALAGAQMRRQPADHTLQPTALVNEAYLRLFSGSPGGWNDRRHFLRAAAAAMRSVLVDMARRRNAQRRGGDRAKVTFEEWGHATPDGVDIVAVHDALEQLAQIDPRGAEIVELRFFGGLSVEETAKVLGVTERTVYRDWNAARVWLYQALEA